MPFIPLLGPKNPPPEDPPPDDEPPEDSPAPEGPPANEPASEGASDSLTASPLALLTAPWVLHNSRIRAPADDWDPVFGAHRWILPREALYESLWQESQARRDEIWARARAAIAASVRTKPPQREPPSLHPMAFVYSLRAATTLAEREATMAWLEAVAIQTPEAFGQWLVAVVSVTDVLDDKPAEDWLRLGDRGLLYEVILGELRVQDAKWPASPPLPSVRFAALLNAQLQEQPLLVFGPLGARWGFWEKFVTRWRGYFEGWMLHQRPSKPVGRLLLVPGESRADAEHMDDENAKDSSVKRAVDAVPAIRDHLAKCPEGTVLVVLVSGGQVRSETAEAEFMADILRDPRTWGGPVPDGVVIMEDGLSRHTSNNLRAAGQLAMRFGLAGFWVQTSGVHATTSLGCGWWGRYQKETTWGLPAASRARLAQIAPMVIPLTGPRISLGRGRARCQDLRAMVFVPAVGDALNP